jgi:glutamyl-tRNA synthetase
LARDSAAEAVIERLRLESLRQELAVSEKKGAHGGNMVSPVKVRMAPSPTGFLHVGTARTFLFNWLFARQQDGDCLLRIENTDMSREVEGATEQIQRSLTWLGLDWDSLSFQLDRMERCQHEARWLVESGHAYEDEGAIRFRMPDEGVTAYDDLVLGRVETPNEVLDDFVLVRADGRPTYNFASPVEDWLDGITHVIRGRDHISNTPKQINILRALGAEIPRYAHLPDVLGEDGKKLSKRHGATALDEFRRDGYYAPALMNFLALLGWSYDDRTTIMSRAELIERFSFERVQPSPATFDYKKLNWMNGVYLRALTPDEYADVLVEYLGPEWDERKARQIAPLVQDKLAKLSEFPAYASFFFQDDVEPDPSLLEPDVLAAARSALEAVDSWDAATIEATLRGLAERLGLKPAQAFQPIRVAVTGSKISPGLFESLELLGSDESLRRLSRAVAAAA